MEESEEEKEEGGGADASPVLVQEAEEEEEEEEGGGADAAPVLVQEAAAPLIPTPESSLRLVSLGSKQMKLTSSWRDATPVRVEEAVAFACVAAEEDEEKEAPPTASLGHWLVEWVNTHTHTQTQTKMVEIKRGRRTGRSQSREREARRERLAA